MFQTEEEEKAFFRNATDEKLLEMVRLWDDDFSGSALVELSDRKYPEIAEVCRNIAETVFTNDEFVLSLVLHIWYSKDEETAIIFIKEHYKELSNYALQTVLSNLWVDSKQQNMPDYKKEMILLMRAYLDTRSRADIKELGEDYKKFMEAYGNW